MASMNTDTVEEDAADLQFPKDWTLRGHYDKFEMPVEKKEIFTSDSICFICKSIIFEPYIRCAVCNYIWLCNMCFAKGEEKLNHKNHHDYIIIKNDFPLMKYSDWTAKEEKSLLYLLLECGFGNWIDISYRLPGRSPEDCKKHYLQYYVDNLPSLALSKLKETAISLFGLGPTPFSFKLVDIEDPPRFADGTLNNRLMAGYNAVRSDFLVNFDNHAEILIADLKYDEFSQSEPYFKLGQELQLALIGFYNARLKERARRKRIIRNHGLISSRKALSCLQRYDVTLNRPLTERLRIFTQLVSGIEFDSIAECLHRIGQLKNYLGQLYHYRRNGIEYFHSVPMFEELSRLRQNYEREKKQYISTTEYNWKSLIPITSIKSTPISTNVLRRRIAPPLDIHPGLIGYEKLSATERDICSIARILPEAYINIKQLLISENKKSGSMKLAQARQLLKIDVNKTKKIHEFLANEGYININ